MPTPFLDKLVIGISSRALFDLDESHLIYERDGVMAYQEYQITHEDEPLETGVAFHLVKKLLRINELLLDKPMVEVILLSRNSSDTGLRVFKSIEHYQLNITRAVFTSGHTPYQYVSAFGAHLFLSTNPEDVRNALNAGCAAATITPSAIGKNNTEELRIAFDGDAVIFSDEAEKIYQTEGLAAFTAKEKADADKPLSGGPFKGFLAALHALQNQFPIETCPIRTALVTARSAPAHERVIKTLRAWNIRLDEALFLGGLPKGEFLQAFGADFFFDDQHTHCHSATSNQVATGHVPHGVVNQDIKS
ncbi:MAG: 5'-nucleotidase [Gammaproteobacteria bacterium]